MIEVKNMTLTYPSGKGVFDLDFKVSKGEVMGCLGPNGAGKTTTIRALLGFMKPNSGYCTINGLDCASKAPEIQRILGYIPGEISFFDGMNGDEFLSFMCKMRGTKDLTRQKQLIDMFEFSPKGKIKKLSKGMKQKLGIVAAFMHNPEVLILDEPASGLDPLMQLRLIELVLEEKKKGKTLLISSHMFEEVEKTCDNVLMLKDGRIIKQSDINAVKSSQEKSFIISVSDTAKAVSSLEASGFMVANITESDVEVHVKVEAMDSFIKAVSKLSILDLETKAQTLEDLFMRFYGKGVDAK